MSKKIERLTGCQSALEHLRVDAESGKLLIYNISSFPTGIIPKGYLDQCSSVTVAVTGSGNFDYIVIMPSRPDEQKAGSTKEIDIDPAVFCFQRDDLSMFPTGIKLNHQNFPLRTSPISGYETFTVEQTMNDLRQTLITGYQPISGSPSVYLNAISHGVAKINGLFGPQISGWENQLNSSNEPGM